MTQTLWKAFDLAWVDENADIDTCERIGELIYLSTMTKPTKPKGKPRGGAREGAGRKPYPLGTATVRKTIQLTPAEWAQLAKIHKIASQAIRQILKEKIK